MASRRSARVAPIAACRMPRISAWKLRLVVQGAGAGTAARQLRRRARICGGREHPELDAQHGFYHAEERSEPGVPRRDARSRTRLRLRPPPCEQRPPVDPEHLSGLAAEHARYRTLRGAMLPGAPAVDAPFVRSRARMASSELGNGFVGRCSMMVGACLLRASRRSALFAGSVPVPVLVVEPLGFAVGKRSDGITLARIRSGSGYPTLRWPARHLLSVPAGSACGCPMARVRSRSGSAAFARATGHA